jgi:hypothetical protein
MRVVVYLNDCSVANDKSPATPMAQAIQPESGTVFRMAYSPLTRGSFVGFRLV